MKPEQSHFIGRNYYLLDVVWIVRRCRWPRNGSRARPNHEIYKRPAAWCIVSSSLPVCVVGDLRLAIWNGASWQ